MNDPPPARCRRPAPCARGVVHAPRVTSIVVSLIRIDGGVGVVPARVVLVPARW